MDVVFFVSMKINTLFVFDLFIGRSRLIHFLESSHFCIPRMNLGNIEL